jgi:Asp-tRNA(Asn)/Glu-tRNA(Gln) amidotransferase C subunit
MLQEKRIAQAIEKMVNPPMTGPSVLKNQKASILPGDITYVDVGSNSGGFRPAHEVNVRIAELEQKQQQLRDRIQQVFYANLFLMLANDQRSQITATEINERKEEKLLALGPVLEQLNQDLLDPLIDIAFDIMDRQGLFPPPPEEINGIELKVEYVSVMALAQKLIAIGAHDRFMSYIGQVAQFSPDVMDKVDLDQSIDIYGEITSVSPGVVRSDEDVQSIRDQRAQSQAKQAQVEQMNQVANTAKQLSETDTEGQNALTGLMKVANAGNLVPQ